MDWRFQSSLGSLLLYKILIFVTQFVNKNSSSYTAFMGLASYKYAEGYFKVDTWHLGACHALITWYYDIVFASKCKSRGPEGVIHNWSVIKWWMLYESVYHPHLGPSCFIRVRVLSGGLYRLDCPHVFLYWRSKSFVYWFTAQHQQTRIWCLWQKVPWLSKNTRRAGA